MNAPDDHLRPSQPPNPARFPETRTRRFRRVRRWYRRTPTNELVTTVVAVAILVLVVVAAVVYLLL